MTHATEQDWHPEDIKAAIRKTGASLTALAVRHGLSESAVRTTLRQPWPRVQAIIARHIGLAPQILWPSRYDAKGRPLAGLHSINRMQRSPGEAPVKRQKSEAA